MTPQEIIKEIQKLPLEKRKEVFDSFGKEADKSSINEDEFLRALYAEGIIGNIPDFNDYTDEDDDFEPIEIKGKLTSEIIIEERR